LKPTSRNGIFSSADKIAAGFGLMVVFALNVFLCQWGPDSAMWNKAAMGFYGWQTEAIVNGQLYLKIEPSPELALAANPYEGAQNRDYRIQDLSYYRGKYYSYFGAGPILVVTLPWYLLTRTYLTDAGATQVLAWIFCGLSLAILVRLQRRFYPSVGPLALVSAYAVLTLGSYLTIHYVTINTGAIAQMGACCCLLATYLALINRPASPRTYAPLAWASFWCGMAIACRPSFILLGTALLPFAFAAWRKNPSRWLQIILASAWPFGALLVALLCYNYVRFDSFLEFGHRLQLNDADYRYAKLFGPKNIPGHLRDFFFYPQAFTHYFPFVANQSDRTPVGLLWACPVTVLATGLVLARRKKPGQIEAELGILFAFAGVILLLAAFKLFLFHYEPDFFVPAVLTAILGWFALLETSSPHAVLHRGLNYCGITLCALTVALCTLQSLSTIDFNRKIPALTRAANGWVDHWDQWRGVRYGPIHLKVTFAPEAANRRSPLLLTGSFVGDLCYAAIDEQFNLRVGLFHTGAGGPLSDPIPIQPDHPYELEIQMGSLLPETHHPFFDGYSVEEIKRAKSLFRVSLDGQVVLESLAAFYPASPEARWVGVNPVLSDVAAAKFIGAISHKDTAAFPRVWAKARELPRTGAVSVRFRLPETTAIAGIEPILTSGNNPRCDAIVIEYLSDGSCRFGLDHWGAGALFSDPVTLPRNSEHRLHIRSNSLAALGSTVEQFELILDDLTLLSRPLVTYPSDNEHLHWGVNAIGSGSCSAMFSGTILGVAAEAIPDKRAPNRRAISQPGILSFNLRLEPKLTGTTQPLVVSGVTGAADILGLQIIDAQHARFVLDHWGVGLTRSDVVEFDPSKSHRFLIEYGPIFQSHGATGARSKSYRVTVDAKILFEGTAEFYPVHAEDIHIGSNPIGASTTGEQLRGYLTEFVILPADRP
jgi:hypothetical protein